MDTEYKITFKNNLYFLKELFKFLAVGIVGYLIIILYLKPGSYYLTAIVLVVTYLMLVIIPMLVIHFQYYKYNKEMELFVDEQNRSISIIYQGVKHYFHFNQIENIKLALTHTLYRGLDRGISVWELYHYAVLETKDGKQFVITCLLVNDLRIFFKDLGLETIKVRKYFPWIRVPSAYQQKTNL